MTRKGSLIPNVFFGSAGQVMYVVLQKEEIPVNTRLNFPFVARTEMTHGPRGQTGRHGKDPDLSRNESLNSELS